MYDLLIKNGKLVTPELVQEGNVAVKDGKIAAILAVGEEPVSDSSNRCTGKIRLPGRNRHSCTLERSGIRMERRLRTRYGSGDSGRIYHCNRYAASERAGIDHTGAFRQERSKG